jgi:hypothetical protein
MFVEFFPDPTEVPDGEGEFVEIRLDDFRADSLFVGFDRKSPLAFEFPRGANRLLLVHDSAACPARDSLACGLLGAYSLPNSRGSEWVLRSGSCSDSVELPAPKPGKALQRIGETSEWAFTSGTPGAADPAYELGIRDCGVRLDAAEFRDGVGGQVRADGALGPGWVLRGVLLGCDSAAATVEVLDLGSAGGWRRDSVTLSGVFSLQVGAKGSAWVRLVLPADAAPSNDSVDCVLALPGNAPVALTEVHHCPSEPEPEWVEVYNSSRYALPLSRLRLCGRGGAFGGASDSLRPYESVLVTKDSAGLRGALGFRDVRIVQVSMGFLNNVSGSVSLCLDSVAVDSVAWTKNTVACPSGFNPLFGRAENTPGYQRPGGGRRARGTVPVQALFAGGEPPWCPAAHFRRKRARSGAPSARFCGSRRVERARRGKFFRLARNSRRLPLWRRGVLCRALGRRFRKGGGNCRASVVSYLFCCL